MAATLLRAALGGSRGGAGSVPRAAAAAGGLLALARAAGAGHGRSSADAVADGGAGRARTWRPRAYAPAPVHGPRGGARRGWNDGGPDPDGVSVEANALSIGFLGIDQAIGRGMAGCLLKSGHSLFVCDPSGDFETSSRFQAMGAEVVGTPAELASKAQSAIVTFTPGPEMSEQVYLGPEGILRAKGGVRAPLLIDCTTSCLATVHKIHAAAATTQRLQSTQMHGEGAATAPSPLHPMFVDAPVSGGQLSAQNCALTFMAGGSPRAVAASKDVLLSMGNRLLRCGPSGTGVLSKLVHGLVLANTMAALSEGLALGAAHGMDPTLLTSVLNASTARSWLSMSYSPVPGAMEGTPASRVPAYDGGLQAELLLRDLEMAREAAEKAQLPHPMTDTAVALYAQVRERGGGARDFSSVYSYVYHGAAVPSVDTHSTEATAERLEV